MQYYVKTVSTVVLFVTLEVKRLKDVHLEVFIMGNSRQMVPQLCLLLHWLNRMVDSYCWSEQSHRVSTELFYFRSDDLVAWCFKYYWPCSSSYISFHGASTLIWSSSEIREAHHCPSLSLNWKNLRSMMSLFMLWSDCQIQYLWSIHLWV